MISTELGSSDSKLETTILAGIFPKHKFFMFLDSKDLVWSHCISKNGMRHPQFCIRACSLSYILSWSKFLQGFECTAL